MGQDPGRKKADRVVQLGRHARHSGGILDSHTAIDIGPFAVGAMTFEQATVNDIAGELLAIPVTEGSHDANYFPRMLKALSLVTLTGQFTQCGGQ